MITIPFFPPKSFPPSHDDILFINLWTLKATVTILTFHLRKILTNSYCGGNMWNAPEAGGSGRLSAEYFLSAMNLSTTQRPPFSQ